MEKTFSYIIGNIVHKVSDSMWGKTRLDCQCGYNRNATCSAPSCKNVDRTVDYIIRGRPEAKGA